MFTCIISESNWTKDVDKRLDIVPNLGDEILFQGIELSNPQAQAALLGSGTQSTYFSETGTFSKIKRI